MSGPITTTGEEGVFWWCLEKEGPEWVGDDPPRRSFPQRVKEKGAVLWCAGRSSLPRCQHQPAAGRGH